MLQAAKQVASIQNIVICFEELLFLITSFCYLQFSTKQKNRRSLGGCFHQKEGNSEKQGPDQSAGGSTSVFWLTHKPTQKEMRGTRSHAARLNIIAEYQNLIASFKDSVAGKQLPTKHGSKLVTTTTRYKQLRKFDCKYFKNQDIS